MMTVGGGEVEDRLISLKAAIDAVENCEPGEELFVIKSLPSAQPESYEDKLKEIADALSEKMRYMNTCPNERDIILGYLGRKRPSKNHCNTDCWNEKCESYHYETKQQPEQQSFSCGHENDPISRQAAIDVVHKIIYGFFDLVDDDSEEPLSDKNKLLLEVNKAVCDGIKDL